MLLQVSIQESHSKARRHCVPCTATSSQACVCADSCMHAQLVTNKRRPILTLVEDTCGVHDTLMSGQWPALEAVVILLALSLTAMQCSVRHLQIQGPRQQI